MTAHDLGYKLLFSHPRMVEDLLRGFVHEEWVSQLDFSSLERVNQSYVSDDLRSREEDLVWRLRRRDGDPVYVYLLFEFQSSVDRFMAVRVLAYVALLYQDLIRRRDLTPAGKLPPVVPVVLYNGRPRWRAAREVSGLIETAPGGLEDYRPRLRYLLLDEGRLGAAEISGLRNLAAALFRLERSRDAAEASEVVEDLARWLASPGLGEIRRAFAAWIRWVLLPRREPGAALPAADDLEGVATMLRENILDWTRKAREEGLESGRQEGLEEGLREGEARVLLRQIERKFGPPGQEVRDRVTGADPARLLDWSERLLTADRVEEIFDGQQRP